MTTYYMVIHACKTKQFCDLRMHLEVHEQNEVVLFISNAIRHYGCTALLIVLYNLVFTFSLDMVNKLPIKLTYWKYTVI